MRLRSRKTPSSYAMKKTSPMLAVLPLALLLGLSLVATIACAAPGPEPDPEARKGSGAAKGSKLIAPEALVDLLFQDVNSEPQKFSRQLGQISETWHTP